MGRIWGDVHTKIFFLCVRMGVGVHDAILWVMVVCDMLPQKNVKFYSIQSNF